MDSAAAMVLIVEDHQSTRRFLADNLAADGEVTDPASALGEHVNDCWPELVGPSERSLVHWMRRLIFRSAWLDQRVKEGELDVALQ